MNLRVTLIPTDEKDNGAFLIPGSATYGLHAASLAEAVSDALIAEFKNRASLLRSNIRPLLRHFQSIENHPANKMFFPEEHKKLAALGYK